MQRDLLSQITRKNSEINISKYVRLILDNKKKVFVLAITFILFFLVVFKMFLAEPQYTAESLVRFDDPRLTRNVGAVTDFAVENPLSKIPIIRTNRFLSEVVDSLALQFILVEPKIRIKSIFESYRIVDTLKIGHYEIKFKDGKYNIYYTNKNLGIEDSLILSNPISQRAYQIGGMAFKFTRTFLEKPENLKFAIVKKKSAINRLRNRLKTSLDGSRTILRIQYTSTDPDLTAKTVNFVAEYFVKETLKLKRYKTLSVLRTFEEQLNVARRNLQEAEQALEDFKKKHPLLTLSENLNEDLQKISELEFDLKTSQDALRDLAELEKNTFKNEEEKSIYLKEVLSFLQSRNESSAQILLQNYEQYLTEKRALKDYPPSHPRVQEINKKIRELEERIDELVKEFKADMQNRIETDRREIQQLNTKLRNLPAQETILAKLIRDKEVNERIFSSVLVKYNEAKIADAAVIPDAYLLDYALVPETSSQKIFILLILAGGIIFCIVGAVGVVILWDFFNPTIKDETDIKFDLDLPVLTSIPVIGDDEEIPKFLDPEDKFKIDPKLITSDYAPNIIGEKYRTLRTHILFSEKEKEQINSLLVTSLNANEGKSLNISNLAITIAQQKIATVLVDTDLRRGVLHRSFVCSKRPGLSDLLNSRADINIKNLQKIIQKTHVPNLFLISSGTQIPNPSELIGSQRMKILVKVLKEKFGFVLFDSPPLSVTTDAIVLSTLVDKVLFVVRAGQTKKKQLIQVVEQFDTLREKTLGIVINGTDIKIEKSNYNYTYYHY